MADQIEGAIKTVLGVGWIELQGRDGVTRTFVALRAAEVQSGSKFPARDEVRKLAQYRLASRIAAPSSRALRSN